MSEHYIGGFHAVMAALEDGAVKPFEILLSDSRQDERARRMLALAHAVSVPVRQVSKSELDMRAPGLRHQGVLAQIPERELLGEDALEAPATPDRLFLALDGVQDPHNLGACLRTAEAVGATAVIIPKDRAASLTAVAMKAAAGSAERVPVISVTNLTRTLELMKERGYWLTGLAGEAEQTLYEVDLTGPLVLVMGAEGAGMRRLTRETCDRLVKIPMLGKTESLNVSVAAAVCLYEAFRQRQPGKRR
ncbi:MAG: rRNA (guanosine-2-O-)-methyltransferase RlmB [Hydrocarboniphaga sp.]|uniref:23S rRNA (guanosine(2251)-2'-O)-methyltransferase RlmB n=1 Tax=Hydrocarboniphaga sp. TaxID=2033016 RepID=UPI00261BFCFD|nr:23S rRNA (guanosine(2251)-2'-O)-methyltransferase RlmB [Hydrocarboniphaga sp.]MDB5968928.1 rRNA (guanosine-2-O-)-methyltransferase RlmB [Hydrocarboniphaga sp.]